MSNAPTTEITAEGHTVVIDNDVTEVIPANPNPTLYVTNAGITGAITRRLHNAGLTSGFKARLFGDFACEALVHANRIKPVINVLVDAGYRVRFRPATTTDCYRIGVIGNMTFSPIDS